MSADVTASINLTCEELAREEQRLAESKDYAGAARLHNEAETLSGLAAAVADLDEKEKTLADAKDYEGAQAANEECAAVRAKAAAEEGRVRQISLGSGRDEVADAAFPPALASPSDKESASPEQASPPSAVADSARPAAASSSTSSKSWTSRFNLGSWSMTQSIGELGAKAMHRTRELIGTTDRSRLTKLVEKPAAALDVAEMERLLELAWAQRRKLEEKASTADGDAAAAATESLGELCVPEAELEAAQARLREVSDARRAAAEHLLAVRVAEMAEQDADELGAALSRAEEAGVGHAAYKLDSSDRHGEAGAEVVRSARAWMYQVRGVRAAVEAHLRAAADASPAEVDIDVLRAEGVDAAAAAGGIDKQLLSEGRKKLEAVVAARASAVAALQGAQKLTMAEQDAAALEAALAEAQAAGVAHANYKLEGGAAGSGLVATAATWLKQVQDARSAAKLCLVASLVTSAAELDIEVLTAQGIDAAAISGGVAADLIESAKAKLEAVLAARGQAVVALRAARKAVVADQDAAELEEALSEAQERGVAHPSHRLGEALGGGAGCELVSDAYAWLSQVRRAAAEAEMARTLSIVESLAATQLQLRRAENAARGGRSYALAGQLCERWHDFERLRASPRTDRLAEIDRLVVQTAAEFDAALAAALPPPPSAEAADEAAAAPGGESGLKNAFDWAKLSLEAVVPRADAAGIECLSCVGSAEDGGAAAEAAAAAPTPLLSSAETARFLALAPSALLLLQVRRDSFGFLMIPYDSLWFL